jgi:hypothetical protein
MESLRSPHSWALYLNTLGDTENTLDPETLKIVIPIATFILGSVLTWSLKSLEQRRTVVRESVASLRRLVNEWYNQLHELFGHESGLYNEALFEAFTRYLNNRIVLPELLMHLEVIRQRDKCTKLVEQVENFLEIVTNYSKNSNQSSSVSAGTKCSALFSPEVTRSPSSILDELDPVVQKIAIESGVLLRS